MNDKKLVLTFKDETDSKFNLTIGKVNDTFVAGDCTALMDYIITNNIIGSKNGNLKLKVSAVRVDTIRTEHSIQ